MNDSDPKGRVAVAIIGARGAGLAMEERLTGSGASVRLWDVRANSLETGRSALGPRASGNGGQCRRRRRRSAADAAETAQGRIDIPANSAGMAQLAAMVAWLVRRDYDFTTASGHELSGGRATR